ncbi:MAG: hypothetical protein ACT4P6_21880 [Gemmatimonadaceae bacterium]
MRALALAGTPLASGELARRARVTRTSIYPALAALERSGIVEFVGAGSQRHAQFRQRHPLAHAVRELFAAEERRVDAFIAELRDVFNDALAQLSAAWLEGLEDAATSTSDALALYVLGDPKSLTEIVDQVSERVTPVERSFGVHLDIRSLTRSELETRAKKELDRLQEAVLLYGVPPTGLTAGSSSQDLTLRSHDEHDVRARRLAVAIAAKLKSDPGLIRLARRQIARRTREASPREQRELKEWSRLLTTMSHARLQKFLVEDSESATRLRQSLPGLGLLTSAERAAAIKSKTDEEARTAVSRK